MNLMISSTIGLLFVAESIGSQGVLESDSRGDLAGEDFLDLFALVGLEADDAAEALFLAGRGIVDIGTGFDGAGIDAEEGQRADEWVVLELEGQSARKARCRRRGAGSLRRYWGLCP